MELFQDAGGGGGTAPRSGSELKLKDVHIACLKRAAMLEDYLSDRNHRPSAFVLI